MSDQRAESNPFQPGGPLHQPDRFIGREHELAFIFQHIAKKHPTSVIGGESAGKTWLLRYVMNESTQQRYMSGGQQSIYLYIDSATGLHSPAEFFQHILTGIKEKMPHLKLRDRGSLQRQVYDCLDRMSPQNLVLILDDFESTSRECGFPLESYTFLRLIATDRDVSFIITTRRELYLCLPEPAINSPFANIFTALRIGPFTDDDFETFITWSSEQSGIPVNQWAPTLDEVTGRFPYLLQLACHHYYEVWSEHGGLNPEQEQVALQRYATEASRHMATIWEGLSLEARQILRRVADGEVIDHSRDTERLQLQGLLRKQRLFCPLFTDYVQTQAE